MFSKDAWAKALENHGQLRNSEQFGAWIFRIARNLAFQEVRKNQRKAKVWVMSNFVASEGQIEALLEKFPCSSPGPLERAICHERHQLIQHTLEDLDPATQMMLQLRYYERLTLAEIASALNVPLGTVCTKVHRGLKTIQQRLTRQGVHSLHEI